MSDWIRQIAENIREKDHHELLEKEHQLHVAKLIAEHGKFFWDAFCNSFTENVEQLKRDLENPVLVGNLSAKRQQNKFSVEKSEFPFVNMVAEFSPIGASINCTYTVANPRRITGPTAAQAKTIQFNFRVGHQNAVHLEIEKHHFQQGSELAEYLMKLLFSV